MREIWDIVVVYIFPGINAKKFFSEIFSANVQRFLKFHRVLSLADSQIMVVADPRIAGQNSTVA